MAGPIIEAVKKRLNNDSDFREEVIEQSPLTEGQIVEQYKDELGRRMPSGGGCCSAAEVAEAMREGEKFD